MVLRRLVGGVVLVLDAGVLRRRTQHRETHRVVVVDRHRPDADMAPGVALLRAGHHYVVVVREGPVAHAHVVGRTRRGLQDTGAGLFIRKVRHHGGDFFAEAAHAAPHVREAHMRRVERILDLLEPVAIPVLHEEEQVPRRVFEHVLPRQVEFRRGPLAHVREDQRSVFMQRITRQLDEFRTRATLLRRHLGALPRSVVTPAVVHATQLIALNVTGVQHRAAVRASTADEIRLAAFAAVEREILAHHAQRLRLSDGEVAAAGDRLPEAAKQHAHRRALRGFRQKTETLRPHLRAFVLLHARLLLLSAPAAPPRADLNACRARP